MFYGNPLRICLFILAIFQIACLASGVNLRPVHERNNEQKIDSYGNPLGGNTQGGSRQRVKIYMHDQQKRFNAEKDRMQRAQAQRFQKHGGETMDSYVKAYKDQQESYQKEIETKHAKEVTNITSDVNSVKSEQPSEGRKREIDNKERKDFAPLNRWWKNSRPARNNRGSFKNADSVAARPALRGQHIGKTHSSRSVPFVVSPNYFTPSATHENSGGNYYGFAPQNLFLNPSMTSSILAEGYAPGKYYNTEDVSALTSATLSNSQGHQFSQLSGYKSNEDVESLTALLGQQPGDQLRGLNQLLNQHSNHKLIGDDLSYLNINLKASSLDPNDNKNLNKYDYISPYSTDAQKQLLGYTFDDSQSQVVQTKDHTPITENVQDIADTRGPVQFGLPRPVYPTESPLIHTSLSDNYYKVSSQPSYDVEPKILNSPSSYSASSSSYGSGNDDLHYASQYDFGYRVLDHKSGNDFGHKETSDGETASGAYHVLLPDGRLQQVSYRAGPEGYHAKVTYHR